MVCGRDIFTMTWTHPKETAEEIMPEMTGMRDSIL